MLTDPLWGGVLEATGLDVSKQTLTLAVRVTHRDESSRHELRLSGVSEFRFVNAIEGPWDYAEVTEVHFEMDAASRQWTFAVVLWSEDAVMSGRCTAVTVDGLVLPAS